MYGKIEWHSMQYDGTNRKKRCHENNGSAGRINREILRKKRALKEEFRKNRKLNEGKLNRILY